MRSGAAIPTVSVVIATHNGAAFIAEQLESILAQSRLPAEILVSDDASSDATVERVQEIARRDPAIRDGRVDLQIFRNDVALGVTANFEAALSRARGDLIALSDQDDRWVPHRLERALQEFARRPDLTLLASNARLVDREGTRLPHDLYSALGIRRRERRELQGGAGLRALLRRNLVTGATVVVRRDVVERAMPFPASWVHDEWLAMIAAIAGRIDILDDELVHYRQHGGNQIGASRLSLGGKYGRLTEPRERRNARLLARAEALSERLRGAGPKVDPAVLAMATAKVQHERVRSRYPAPRVRRLLPVLREALTGRYGRYGRGLIDVARDLVQPPGGSGTEPRR